MIHNRKLRSLYFTKRVSDTLIVLSAAVILISLFTFFIIIPYYNTRIMPHLTKFPDRAYWIELYNYINYIFLPSMIIPCAITIAIFTPIRIIAGKLLKIQTLVHFKIDKGHQIDLYKLKKNRDYQDLY